MHITFVNTPFLPRFSRESRSPAVTKSDTLYYPKWLALAAGYSLKNGKEINTKLDKVKTLLQKGDGVEIDRSGKYTKKPKKPTGSGATSSTSTGENSDYNLGDSSGNNGLGNLQFSYITISTIYSTGTFIPEENYVYRYINLPADEELPEVITPEEAPEKDIKPDRIIFGIYNKNGTPINPM